ncbi:MAG: hypothetical protein MUC42_16730 [Bryobacter sp.]|jgi:hypothetical protein|nr:hypothetical protein [Bryobacter sp.]
MKQEELKSIAETRAIIEDRALYEQIMKALPTLDEDVRNGRLHEFEEAFEQPSSQ